MGNHQNVIELNGKRYDAKTGRILESPQPVHTAQASAHGGHVIDGVHHKPTHKITHKPVHKSVSHTVHSAPVATHDKPAQSRKAHKPAAHHTRSNQRAATLMRSAVRKPELASISGSVAPEPEPTQTAKIMPKLDQTRLTRAKHIKKSTAISRFGHPGQQRVSAKVAPLAVREAPKHTATHHTEPTPKSMSHHQATAHTTTRAHKPKTSEDHFVRAMNNAHAHEAATNHHKRPHTPGHKTRRRLAGIGTVAFASLLLIAFIAYQNIPNLSMRVASSRAGFDAQLPGYRPAGFAMSGPIEYGSGYITVTFRSNSDERNYHVTQKVSNWTSESLAASFLASNDKPYQAIQEKGKTIYLYGDNNATWVSGGVWYQIEGDAGLSSEQLIGIANSI